jgi:hypothetical protein
MRHEESTIRFEKRPTYSGLGVCVRYIVLHLSIHLFDYIKPYNIGLSTFEKRQTVQF